MDRQLIRMNESLESVKTISECIKRCGRWNRRSRYLQNLLITNMESMIHYFKLVSEGYTFGCSETYLRQEAPKGELGSQVLSGIIKPDRVKIRSPDYYNLQALNIISSCHYLADLIAVLGSADFVLGSVDRITNVIRYRSFTPIRQNRIIEKQIQRKRQLQPSTLKLRKALTLKIFTIRYFFIMILSFCRCSSYPSFHFFFSLGSKIFF